MSEQKTEYSVPAVGYSCHRCEQFGHTWHDCKRADPKTPAERDKRNARHVERWQAGIISVDLKRKFIAAENKPFKLRKARGK